MNQRIYKRLIATKQVGHTEISGDTLQFNTFLDLLPISLSLHPDNAKDIFEEPSPEEIRKFEEKEKH